MFLLRRRRIYPKLVQVEHKNKSYYVFVETLPELSNKNTAICLAMGISCRYMFVDIVINL